MKSDLSIFIVDDEIHACKRLEKLIRMKYPYANVVIWTNPIEALNNIDYHNLDVLFLDIEMPNMTGLEVIKELNENGLKAKVIFTTAFDQYILKALRSEAFDYLLKPIDQDELNKAFNRFENIHYALDNKFDCLAEKGLSKREIEIVKLIFEGNSSKEISDHLFISKSTVDKHRTNILAKSGCRNTTELFTMLK